MTDKSALRKCRETLESLDMAFTVFRHGAALGPRNAAPGWLAFIAERHDEVRDALGRPRYDR